MRSWDASSQMILCVASLSDIQIASKRIFVVNLQQTVSATPSDSGKRMALREKLPVSVERYPPENHPPERNLFHPEPPAADKPSTLNRKTRRHTPPPSYNQIPRSRRRIQKIPLPKGRGIQGVAPDRVEGDPAKRATPHMSRLQEAGREPPETCEHNITPFSRTSN
jgi:hypothetical protein